MLSKARVEVKLKPGHSDPEGETTAISLRELGYKVKDVSVSKMYTISIETTSQKEAEVKLEEICMKLLANPTKDDYFYQVESSK
jgi:phosphoribosylformylglycinamidine synthase